MKNIIFFFMLCLLPQLVLANPHACFQGEWMLDIKKSDNAQRLLNKLERKQKQQQRVLNRSGSFRSDEKEDLSLVDTLPSFVFLQDDLLVDVLANEVVLRQKGLIRRLSTSGSGQAVSLKMLEQQSDTRVAGWENDTLVVETTAVDGSTVKEVFSMQGNNTLLIGISIQQGFEKEIVMEKSYQRKNAIHNCMH